MKVHKMFSGKKSGDFCQYTGFKANFSKAAKNGYPGNNSFVQPQASQYFCLLIKV
jgi:hypothetical protein